MPVNPATAKIALTDHPVAGPEQNRSAAAGRRGGAAADCSDGGAVPAAYLASVTATSAQRVFSTTPGNCGAETAPAVQDQSAPPKVADLAPAQVTVARTIYLTTLGVGRGERWDQAKTERAVLVAFAVAMQESRLGAAAGIDRPNGDGDAGVFQQRTLPGWYGTLAQVRDVGYGARVFLRGKTVSAADVAAARANGSGPAGPSGYTIPGLKQIPGWPDLPITVAAQRVQRSAFPSAYAQHEQIARSLLAVFKDKVDPRSAEAMIAGVSVMCGPTDAMSCTPSGSSAEAGLNPDALRVLRCIHHGWPQITTYYGVGERPANVDSDHPAGNARRRDDSRLSLAGRGCTRGRGCPVAGGQPEEARREVRDLECADLVGGAAGGGLAPMRHGRRPLLQRSRRHGVPPQPHPHLHLRRLRRR